MTESGTVTCAVEEGHILGFLQMVTWTSSSDSLIRKALVKDCTCSKPVTTSICWMSLGVTWADFSQCHRLEPPFTHSSALEHATPRIWSGCALSFCMFTRLPTALAAACRTALLESSAGVTQTCCIGINLSDVVSRISNCSECIGIDILHANSM